MAQHLELATGRVLRRSLPDDAPRLVAMFERCSPETRYARFLAPIRHFPPGHLVDIVRPSHIRRSWVVDDLDAGQLLAVGSWFRNELVSAEVGLLVEDAAQRQGIGTELLDVIVASARAAGITTLVATTVADARHVHCMLARLGPMTMHSTGFTTELHIDLSPG
jgi:GNAT superfamily N-acetyltransferase